MNNKFKFSEISLFKKVDVVEANDWSKKPTAKWRENIIVVIIMTLILMIVSQIPMAIYSINEQFELSGEIDALIMYFQFISIWIIVLAYMAATRNNRVLLKYFKPGYGGNTLNKFFIGLAIGFGMNAFCILVAFLCGNLSFELTAFNPFLIIVSFIAVIIQSGAEELLDRGYLFRKIQRRYRMPGLTMIVTATIFAAMHLANPGIGPLPLIDIFLSGIIFAAMVYYWNSFWAATACHTAWNFTQNIIFGLPNSGQTTDLNILHLASAPTSSFAYDTAFGIEGSVLAVIVELVVAIAIIYLGERKLQSKKISANQNFGTY